MFVLGHLGIGLELSKPFLRRFPKHIPAPGVPYSVKFVFLPIFSGALFPDFLDKTIYYGLSFLTGLYGEGLGILAGTRTFGHTFLFGAFLFFISWKKGSQFLWLLSIGWASHLFLDHVDGLTLKEFKGFLWPFLGFQFPVYPYKGVQDHVSSLVRRPYLWGGELVGGGLMIRFLIQHFRR
jgi:hypothetical protein